MGHRGPEIDVANSLQGAFNAQLALLQGVSNPRDYLLAFDQAVQKTV